MNPIIYLMVDLHLGYDRKVIAGIQRYAREHAWDLRIDNQWRQTLNPPADAVVHGVIGRVSSYDLRKPLIARGIPCVDISGDVLDQLPTACTDEAGVATLAAHHFHQRGLHHTAFFGPRQNWAIRRAQAWQAHLQQLQWPKPSLFLFQVDPPPRPTRDQREHLRAQHWLSRLPKPTAIFCANDEIAVQLLDLIREAPLRVPGDLAVLGCDNDEMICNFARPTLSSVNISEDIIGYNAATILAALLRGDVSHPISMIPPQDIVTRQSTMLYERNTEHIATALELIQLRTPQGITAADVVEAIPTSRRALERRFKQVVGQTIHQHILEQRIHIARTLLETTTLNMEEVATRSGFSSTVRLSTTFKQLAGQTPTQCRQKANRM